MYIRYIKRIIDILLTVIIFIPCSLVMLIIAICIKADDGGSVIYAGERLGKDCRVFKMYKFRSMKENAPNILNPDGSTYNSPDDPRLTRIGKVLRETSLDEIPQIINILKGEMSFIGPRPSLNVLDTYKEDELGKMKVLPGITGYNQAYFRNSISNREKRLNDVVYANNLTFVMDMKIFFKTISTVLRRESIYANTKQTDINVSMEAKEEIKI